MKRDLKVFAASGPTGAERTPHFIHYGMKIVLDHNHVLTHLCSHTAFHTAYCLPALQASCHHYDSHSGLCSVEGHLHQWDATTAASSAHAPMW